MQRYPCVLATACMPSASPPHWAVLKRRDAKGVELVTARLRSGGAVQQAAAQVAVRLGELRAKGCCAVETVRTVGRQLGDGRLPAPLLVLVVSLICLDVLEFV